MVIKIWSDILIERVSQNSKWGADHDMAHNSHDWVAILAKHVGKAVMDPWDKSFFRSQMVKVAAVAVAAIEWCDKKDETDNV